MYIYFELSTKDYSEFFEESIIEVVLKIASKKLARLETRHRREVQKARLLLNRKGKLITDEKFIRFSQSKLD